jgi:predicted phage terminase large subunit-like protein
MKMPKNSAIELARVDLAAYGAAQSSQFELAPHHQKIVEELERIERGEIDRLMIFMPPRHGKSHTASTLFPAWYLGRHPDRSVIASSYGQELASDFGRRTRGFVTDSLHTTIFPRCVIADDSNAVHRFGLLAGGGYFAVGAGGPITGRGADLLLIDDPIKNAEDARSVTARRSLQTWFEHVAYTRLAPGGAIVLIQTRWHQDDLAGWLLREHAAEGWKVLSLPAIAEKDEGWRSEGEALWPAKFPIETLDRIREAIGSTAWASLYQQRPVAEEGAVFKRNWFRTYSEIPKFNRLIFSLDTAFKTGQSSDYSVIAVIAETTTGYFLLHLSRGRWEFPDLKRQAIALAEIWSPHYVLIEDAASGQSLIQSLKAETRLPILPIRPQGDKIARASAVSPLAESGRVFLPESAPWLAPFVDEACSFPAAPHDDQVDALTQGLSYLRGEGYQPISYQPGPGERGPRLGFDSPTSASTDRLYGSGAAIAAQEDRAAASRSQRWGRGWDTF